jgi:hypothetical protein
MRLAKGEWAAFILCGAQYPGRASCRGDRGAGRTGILCGGDTARGRDCSTDEEEGKEGNQEPCSLVWIHGKSLAHAVVMGYQGNAGYDRTARNA